MNTVFDLRSFLFAGVIFTAFLFESEPNTEAQNEVCDRQSAESILRDGAVVVKNSRETIHCLSIIGQIEGHYLLGDNQKTTKYEHIIPLLVAIEESDEIDGLLIVLNTMGGDVEAGLAIAEMIASMKKPTVSIVLGGGHSIGVPLAVSAKRSFIVPSATMTIHPVRMTGLVVGVPQTFFYFDRMQDRILNFISSHSKIKIDDLRTLMLKTDQIATDVGSIIDGKEAVKYGIIDKVGGLSDALSDIRKMINKERNGNKNGKIK